MSTESTLIRFRALQVANEQRAAYGLRYNDYNRYRKHCANRTHRLRSSLKMTHGKGREFKKLPALNPETMKDNHLHLLLFEAERTWAYSQELYAASLLPANEPISAKLRHSATGRFRRAVHWATELLSHCQTLHSSNKLSANDLVEMTVYTLVLNGRFLRYRDDFEDALEQLCVARDLLDELAKTAETSKDQAFATLFSDEISPEIRVCAHELGRSKSYDVDAIVKDVAPQRRGELVDGYDQLMKKLKAERSADAKKKGGKRQLKALQWEEKEVPVRNPELVDVLLDVQEAESSLQASQSVTEETKVVTAKGKPRKAQKSRKGVAAFDGILLALSNAEEIARKLTEAQQATGSATTSAPGTRDIHFLHSYIIFHLLSRRTQRDLSLVSALIAAPSTRSSQRKSSTVHPHKEQTDPRANPAIVKLLDTILQSLSQMRTLDVVDESPDLANAVEARIAFTKCRRCLYLSRAYAAVKKYAEALSLIQRSHLYHRETLSLLTFDADPINSGSPTFYSLDATSLNDIEKSLDDEEARLKREWFLFNGGLSSAEKDTTKKPLFFDIALNYVQLDMDKIQERAGKMPVAAPKNLKADVETNVKSAAAKVRKEEIYERAATPEPEPESAQRGGLSSLLGGWWGRK